MSDYDPHAHPLAQSARELGLAIELATCTSEDAVRDLVIAHLRDTALARHHKRLEKADRRRAQAAHDAMSSERQAGK